MDISEFLGPAPDELRAMADRVGADYTLMRDLILTKAITALGVGWEVEPSHLADLACRAKSERAAPKGRQKRHPDVLARGASRQCPAELELRCYARGSIGSARGFQILGHLLDCPTCADRTDALIAREELRAGAAAYI